MDVAVLQHLHAAVRGAGGSGGGSAASGAFDCAAAQLQVLGAPALRHAGAADLADELLERSEQLIGSKQVREGTPISRRHPQLRPGCHCQCEQAAGGAAGGDPKAAAKLGHKGLSA